MIVIKIFNILIAFYCPMLEGRKLWLSMFFFLTFDVLSHLFSNLLEHK